VTDVRSILADVAGRRGLGGVGVALVRAGKPTEFICDGLADSSGTPIEPTTVFRIASITKTMTAIGLMQLRDRGLLDLDDPVNDHLKNLKVVPPPGAPPVTFRHLLTHTAGIGEMPRVSNFWHAATWGVSGAGAVPADEAAIYKGTLKTEVPAGSKWAYANHGFVLLGKLVADISGEALAPHMQEHLFGPLGMESSGYLRSAEIGARLATGYHWLFGRFRPMRDYDMTLLGAGAVLSSLQDMARYAEWLTGGGSDGILSRATLEEMITPNHSIGPGLPGNGLAFSLTTYGPHRIFGHDGNMPDFASVLFVAPDAGMAVVVLTNTGTVLGANQLAARVLREQLGVPDPATLLPLDGVVDAPGSWSTLTGSYAPARGFLTNTRPWQMLGGEAQVVVKGRHLTVRALSPVRALREGLALHRTDPTDPLRYALIHDGQVVPVIFDRSGDAPAERMIIGRPVNAVLYRRPATRSIRLFAKVAGAAAMIAFYRRRIRR
jgi:CubicO group peptidase (beta-lactamase class C family)